MKKVGRGIKMVQPDLKHSETTVQKFASPKLSGGKKLGGPKINMIGPDLSGGGWVKK